MALPAAHLPSSGDKKRDPSLFLSHRGGKRCRGMLASSEKGGRVETRMPRGQTEGFFSFQALIDSLLSSLATQKDT